LASAWHRGRLDEPRRTKRRTEVLENTILDRVVNATIRARKVVPMSEEQAASSDSSSAVNIRDARFRRQVRAVLALHEFVMSEATVQQQQMSTDLWTYVDYLYSVRLDRPYAGEPRPSRAQDWQKVGEVSRYFYGQLDLAQRKRFQLRLATGMLMIMPLVLVAIAVIGLCISIFPKKISIFFSIDPSALQFSAFLLWLLCLGSMGSIAFIYVNALAIQIDPTVDLSNRSFMIMRVILGALFALVLTLPFGFADFQTFINGLFPAAGASIQPAQLAAPETAKGLILIIPFLLGFSTPLVLAIMNRMIEGVQTLFGVNVQKLPATKTPP
jgi:hypothetical protein